MNLLPRASTHLLWSSSLGAEEWAERARQDTAGVSATESNNPAQLGTQRCGYPVVLQVGQELQDRCCWLYTHRSYNTLLQSWRDRHKGFVARFCVGAELRNLSLWLSSSIQKSAQLGDEEQAALHHPARLPMCRNPFGGFCELGGSRSALKCCTRAAPDLHETDVGTSDMPGVT